MPKQHSAIYFDYRVCFFMCNLPVKRQAQKTIHLLGNKLSPPRDLKNSSSPPVPWPGMAAEGALGATTQEFPLETADSLHVRTARNSQMDYQTHLWQPDTQICTREFRHGSTAPNPVWFGTSHTQPLQGLSKAQFPLSGISPWISGVCWLFVLLCSEWELMEISLTAPCATGWKEPVIDGTIHYSGILYRSYRFLPPSPMSIISERGLSKSEPDFCFYLLTMTI